MQFDCVMYKSILSRLFLLYMYFYAIPTCRHILTHLQQTTFENIVAKGKIAHNFNAIQ